MVSPNDLECCGCGACVYSCPKKAISLSENENGFLIPIVDDDLCIKCGICINVCDFKKDGLPENEINDCYFAVRNDKQKVFNATSGGICGLISEYILEEKGFVFGCSMDKIEDEFIIHHIEIREKEEINKINGSKYVQSNTEETFLKVKEYLNEKRKVLYIGTPCQIAGLKSFLRKDYEDLYTIDLICHGVPNAKMFNAFNKMIEKKNKIKNSKVYFRKKKKGENVIIFNMYFQRVSGKVKKIFCKLVSYYGYFLSGEIYRNSCYNCKYATKNRVSDITLGDGWGMEIVNPEAVKQNGGNIDHTKGVNSMKINSLKGKKLIKELEEDLTLVKVEFENISKHNHQLLNPTKRPESRDKLFEIYNSLGYEELDKLYFMNLGKKKYLKYKYFDPISRKIPNKVKKILGR